MEEAAEEQLPAPLPLAAAALPHPAAPGGGRHHLLLLLLGSKQLLRYHSTPHHITIERYAFPKKYPETLYFILKNLDLRVCSM